MPSLLMVLLAIVGGLLALGFVVELLDEANEGASDAIEGTGRRAREAVEGGSAVTRVGILAGASLLATLGMEAMQIAAGLNEILGGAPVIVGHLIAGALGYLGVAGVLTTQQWGFAFILVTVVALILRVSNEPEAL
jgi:hypothetical protein